MAKTDKYIAFFDLDLTIISINSGAVLVREAYKTGFLNKFGMLRAIYLTLLYRLRLRKPETIIASMACWLKGVTNDEFSELSKRLVKNYLIPSIRPEILDEIDKHRKNGAEIALLSSALSDICNGIADYLNFDSVISTKMESVDGIMTGKPQGKFCFGKQKSIMLIDYCTKMNYKPEESYYYGDSISDLNVLETVGNPVCIAPDKRLKKIALKRSWRVLEINKL